MYTEDGKQKIGDGNLLQKSKSDKLNLGMEWSGYLTSISNQGYSLNFKEKYENFEKKFLIMLKEISMFFLLIYSIKGVSFYNLSLNK